MTTPMTDSERFEFINRIMHLARALEESGWANNDLEKDALIRVIIHVVDMHVCIYLDHPEKIGVLVARAIKSWDGSIIHRRWKDGGVRETLNELATAVGIDDEYWR